MMTKRRTFTKAERLMVYQKYDGHCAYCGKKIDLKDMQIDHLIPLYRWSGEGGTNDMSNLMPSCRSCNHYKDTFLLEDFRHNIERIPSVLERDRATFRLAKEYDLIRVRDVPVEFYFEKPEKKRDKKEFREMELQYEK